MNFYCVLLPLVLLLREGKAQEPRFLRKSGAVEMIEDESLSRLAVTSPRPRELQEIVIWLVAADGQPEEAYPLGPCDGDCDTDDDCGENLMCFQRFSRQAVPGCLGGDEEVSDFDYCISDSVAPTPSPSMTPSETPSMAPTVTPQPTRGPLPSVQVIQSAEPDRGANASSLFGDYQPTNFSDLVGPLTPSGLSGLLDKCQGICKNDNDCAFGLTCFRRNLGGDVPYCAFEDVMVKQSPLLLDFCTLPPTPAPTMVPTIKPTPDPTMLPTTKAPSFQPTTPSPTEPLYLARFVGMETQGNLARCEGNCRWDGECAGDMVCWGRIGGHEAPGCYFEEDQGNGAFSQEDGYNLCVTPNFIPEGVNRPDPEFFKEEMARFIGSRTNGDLWKCEGNCRGDDECAGDMICWPRAGGMSAPGCYFDEEALDGVDRDDDTNVCIEPRFKPQNVTKLRLWWEEGYRWQEDRDEQYWCMQQSGDSVEIQRCQASGRQTWEMVYVENGTKALIKSMRYGTCLQGGGNPSLQRCRPENPSQQWIPMNGNFTSAHFELTRKGKEAECLANHHHPRDGEPIALRPCDMERSYTTSAWMFWWDKPPEEDEED